MTIAVKSKIAASENAARERESRMFQTEMDSAEALHSMTTRLQSQREEMVALSSEADRARTEAQVYRTSVDDQKTINATLAERISKQEASLRLLVAQCTKANARDRRWRRRVHSASEHASAVHAKMKDSLLNLTKEVLRLRRSGVAREEHFLGAIGAAEESTRRAIREVQDLRKRNDQMSAHISSLDGDDNSVVAVNNGNDGDEEDEDGLYSVAQQVRSTMMTTSEAEKTSRRVFEDECVIVFLLHQLRARARVCV